MLKLDPSPFMFLGAKMLAQARMELEELMHFSKLFWTGKGAPSEHRGKMSDGGGGETAASHSSKWDSM